MKLKEYMDGHDVDWAAEPLSAEQLPAAEHALGVEIGGELERYLLEYGYLGYEYVEFYGMNHTLVEESDMAKQTRYLHQYFPKTEGLVAFENQGEGDYFMVDSHDAVFEYDTEEDTLTDTGMTLFVYILRRFEEVDAS